MFRWYVINTYSGHEKKVKANLEHRLVSLGQRENVREIVVPTEQVVETKDGQKVQTEKRTLPGYVLVNMEMTPDALWVVKDTPGVTGFWQTTCRSTVPLHLPAATMLDLDYIQRASHSTDAAVIVKTIRTLITTEGAY